MALQKTVTLDSEIIVEDSYIRIDTFSGYKESITVSVNTYVSNEAFKAGKDCVRPPQTYTFTPSVADDSTNFIQQGYAYLKTLDEFKDAVDC